MPTVRRVLPLALLAVVGMLVVAWVTADDSGDGDSACAEVVQEPLDPNWVVHLLPGDEQEPEFQTHPPTSGPHFSSPPGEGVQEEPLPEALQVTVLEAGDVLAQYDPDAVTGDELAELEGLAVDPVVVAPNPDLDDPVVLTAWLHKQTCGEVDPDAVTAFADAHRDDAPGIGN